MPHFFAKNLRVAPLPARTKNFEFIFEATNDSGAIIFAKSLRDGQKVLLSKQKRGEAFLVKFNKHFAPHSKEIIKFALKEYAELAGAEILAHNLNAGKKGADSANLLHWREICELLSQNRGAMLEIGFGSGRHILHLAQTHPQKTIIGLEIYRPAISQVLRQIEILGLKNLYVASIDARVLFEVMQTQCLDGIYLHFPVPWEKNPQRRVFSRAFLANAMRTLKAGGAFELITDSKEYFDFARDLAQIYRHNITINPQNAVISKYEARWKRLKKEIFKLEIFPQMVGNLSWGMRFTRRFSPRFVNGPQVLFPSKGKNAVQSHTAITSIVDSAESAESSKKIRAKHPKKSFCYFLLSQKVESSLPLNFNLPNDADSALDSTNPQNLTRKAQNPRISHEVRKSFCYFWLLPKVESLLPYQPQSTKKGKIAESNAESASFGGFESLRGEEGFYFLDKQKVAKTFLDSTQDAESGGKIAESTLDSTIPQNLAESGEKSALDSTILQNLNAESPLPYQLKSTQKSNFIDSKSTPQFPSQKPQSPPFASQKPQSPPFASQKPQSPPFTPQKVCKKEYFLHIKSKYIFDGAVVLFASFGAYYAPSSAYFVICGDEVSTISEIIPTSANMGALGLFMELCFDD